MTTEQLDGARTYEVPADATLPDLRALPKVQSVTTVLPSSLEAVYSDTPELVLADAGITLRRRTGGSDAGWHLKLRGGGDDRSELAEPLRDDDAVPGELLDSVRAYVRDRDAQPVATISTRRIVHRLIGQAGKVLAEVTDDVVTAHATPQHGEAVLSSWREWEIELVTGSPKLLSAAEELFGSVGAVQSDWPSKLHHALGRRPSLPLVPGKKPTAGSVVAAYLAEQRAAILDRDADVRRGEPDAVHKSRVATRRLRSSLSTFRPLFDRERTDPLRAELSWLAASLGRVRDLEVQHDHLVQALAAEPPDLVLGPVAARIEVELNSDHQAARQALLEDLQSNRYFRLLDALDELVAQPPFAELAAGSPRAVLEKRLRVACRRLVHQVERQRSGAVLTEDERLHEVRKAAKRVRYAAEVCAPVLGRKAAALVADAEEIQETLGAHQDTVVLRNTLRGIAVRSFLDGENTFTFGRLHAAEQARADVSKRAFSHDWRKHYSRRLKDWRRS